MQHPSAVDIPMTVSTVAASQAYSGPRILVQAASLSSTAMVAATASCKLHWGYWQELCFLLPLL